MIGMGCYPSCNFTEEIAGDDGIGIGATHTEMGFGSNPAGSHMAYAAAESLGSIRALILLQVHAEKT
jgi:hypothetical protein